MTVQQLAYKIPENVITFSHDTVQAGLSYHWIELFLNLPSVPKLAPFNLELTKNHFNQFLASISNQEHLLFDGNN